VAGHCVQHAVYPAAYGNDESCSIVVGGTSSITLSVERFDLPSMFPAYMWTYDSCSDNVEIDGNYYCGTSGPEGVVVQTGSVIAWTSDGNSAVPKATGWRICDANPPAATTQSCVCGSDPSKYATFSDATACFGANDITNLEVMFSGQSMSNTISSFYGTCSDYDNDGVFQANDLTNMKRYYAGLLPIAPLFSTLSRSQSPPPPPTDTCADTCVCIDGAFCPMVNCPDGSFNRDAYCYCSDDPCYNRCPC